MDNTHGRPVRERREQLLTLLNAWDPAGVLAAGASRNEYQRLVDPLLDVLSRGASKEEASRFIDSEVRRHFGKSANDTAQFVTRLFAWFEMSAAEDE